MIKKKILKPNNLIEDQEKTDDSNDTLNNNELSSVDTSVSTISNTNSSNILNSENNNQVINDTLSFIFNNPSIVIAVIFLILLIFIIFYNKNSIIEYLRFLFNIFTNRQQPTNTTHSPTTLTEETLEIMESIEEMEQEINSALQRMNEPEVTISTEQEHSGEGEKNQSKKMPKSMNLPGRPREALYLFLYKIVKAFTRGVFCGLLVILKIFKKGLGGKCK